MLSPLKCGSAKNLTRQANPSPFTHVAGSLHDSETTTIPYCKSLGSDTVDKGVTRTSSVKGDVADNNVLFSLERRFVRRIDDEPAAG
jgi:hypothetical protein